VVSRSLDDDALNRMNARATPAAMRLRRTTVEHPFGTIKYRIFGHPRLLLRGLAGAQTEMSLAVMAYNIKRIVKVLGGTRITQALARS
jgi:transposase